MPTGEELEHQNYGDGDDESSPLTSGGDDNDVGDDDRDVGGAICIFKYQDICSTTYFNKLVQIQISERLNENDGCVSGGWCCHLQSTDTQV